MTKGLVGLAVMAATMIGTNAVADGNIKVLNEVTFSQNCHEQNGVLSREGELLYAITCRSLKNAELLGAYFPEQYINLTAGDSKMFEDSLKAWGKR